MAGEPVKAPASSALAHQFVAAYLELVPLLSNGGATRTKSPALEVALRRQPAWKSALERLSDYRLEDLTYGEQPRPLLEVAIYDLAHGPVGTPLAFVGYVREAAVVDGVRLYDVVAGRPHVGMGETRRSGPTVVPQGPIGRVKFADGQPHPAGTQVLVIGRITSRADDDTAIVEPLQEGK